MIKIPKKLFQLIMQASLILVLSAASPTLQNYLKELDSLSFQILWSGYVLLLLISFLKISLIKSTHQKALKMGGLLDKG